MAKDRQGLYWRSIYEIMLSGKRLGREENGRRKEGILGKLVDIMGLKDDHSRPFLKLKSIFKFL